jgi:hypothetical protein
MVQLITIQLQLSQNLIKATHLQLLFNSIITTTMMSCLMSLIVINILKYDMWHYEFFLRFFFGEILISIVPHDC